MNNSQQQTAGSFGYKWNRLDSYESPAVHQMMEQWQVRRYGFKSSGQMQLYFSGRDRILDAGCGSALSSSFWLNSPQWESGKARWVGVDISTAVQQASRRLKACPRTAFIQADLQALCLKTESFDTIFSEGVLHHTEDAQRTLQSLLDVLVPGGEILFYVYRKKGPVREFTDDHIRERISDLPPEEAWEALRPLTKLGQQLAELKTEIDIPEAVDLLGIPAGRVDVHRLIYWYFGKLFWNEAFSFEENLHVNFDWYHPKYALPQKPLHRRTSISYLPESWQPPEPWF